MLIHVIVFGKTDFETNSFALYVRGISHTIIRSKVDFNFWWRIVIPSLHRQARTTIYTFETMHKEVKKDSSKDAKSKVKGRVGKTGFVESAIVDSHPEFIGIDIALDKTFRKAKVWTSDGEVRPLERVECGYMPYEYTSEELQSLFSRKITIEEIIEDVLSQTKRYIDRPLRDQILITGNIILSYSLEWINTVHFPFFVGETESGKSAVMQLGRWLAYRCVVSEDWPYADIYNFLGTDEEGAGTIFEDEAQEMGKDRKKIRLYKGSYQKGSKKPIVIMTNKGRTQVFFNTYCCKWFGGESVPQDKGFRGRLVIVYMEAGKPQAFIKDADLDNEDGQTLSRIRNKILVWKIQNVGKGFPMVDSGLEGRDRELWESFLSLFSGTKYESQAKETAEHYLDQRKDTIRDSLEARIFAILKTVLEKQLEIDQTQIWEMITTGDELPGELDSRTGKTYYLDEFDRKLTMNVLSDILQFKFHVKKRKRLEMQNGKRKQVTSYVFDEKSVETLSEKYRIDDPL